MRLSLDVCHKYLSFELFDSRLKQYGGHSRWIARLFKWHYCYMGITLQTVWKFEHSHENPKYFYDGYHNHIWIGFIVLDYGT